MPNTFYTEAKYLSEGITAFGNSLVPLGAFSTKFSKEGAGGSMIVPLIVGGAASTGYGLQGGNDALSAITVPLVRIYKDVEFTQEEANANSVDLTSRYKAAMQSLGAAINQVALSGVASFTNTVPAVNVTGVTYANTVAPSQAALDTVDCPDNDRYLILRGGYRSALSPKASDGIKLDVQSYGFTDAYRSNLLPASVSGCAIHPGTLALGTSLPMSPLKGTSFLLDSQVIEDPEGKLPPIQLTVSPNYNTKGVTATFEVLVGSAVAQAGKGVKIA